MGGGESEFVLVVQLRPRGALSSVQNPSLQAGLWPCQGQGRDVSTSRPWRQARG